MTPGSILLDALATLIADDVATLASVTAMHLHLAMAPFSPSSNLIVADFTEATFTGATAKDAGTGNQTVFTDPVTGLRTIQIKEPAGGWTWVCTAGTGLPQTIYGVYLTDNGDTHLYGSMLLDTPITITTSGQGVHVGYITFSLLGNALI